MFLSQNFVNFNKYRFSDLSLNWLAADKSNGSKHLFAAQIFFGALQKKKTGRPEKFYFRKFQRFHKFLQNFRIFFLIRAFVVWKVWKPQTQEKNNLVEIVAYEIIGKTLCKVSYLATKSTKVLKLSNQTVACQSSLMARQTSTFSLGM